MDPGCTHVLLLMMMLMLFLPYFSLDLDFFLVLDPKRMYGLWLPMFMFNPLMPSPLIPLIPCIVLYS